MSISAVPKGRGLELNFSKGLTSSNAVHSYLQSNLSNYDQEIEPYVISEIAKHVIRQKLFENQSILQKVENFAEDNEYDWIIFNNCFDTSGIPSTPCNDNPPEHKTWKMPAATLMGLISLTGHKVASYKGEMNGRLAHMVMPAKNNPLYQSRSTKQLKPHTEVVNGLWPEEIKTNTDKHCIAPDIFGLASIRNPTNCATRVWYLQDLLDSLPYSTIRNLMRPEFRTTSQSSFDINYVNEGVSVIAEINGKLNIRFSYSKLEGLTPRAKSALTELKAYLDDERTVTRLVLKPGQVLILNNRTLLHGRDNLTNHALYDGNDRWLIRMYGFSYDGWRKLPKNERLQHVATV
ncbi:MULTISPECIES: TauD/TfdA family dioxygenase [Pseudoalteromonas]|uniref:TauD/TfdA-like domain-containing protein n=1 Tax=Pseudoalteromonas rubra TaxID=43658 RepID=A0A5S3V1E5_9GAMM|nr:MULTISPECIES: TauD/TfdA family dioxygenase [Pseudoalteromonas]MCG7562679.1 TauD/TfdA family dioxygenase [Pseudoalteromonas sp. McH1-42]MEC4089766.1 TauD/TfdA family dioxygenase [Pseudoalteromonas rubra]QPB84796.1 hypothetical protein CWC22_018115 [Pseudoalteromonas rubra]